MKRRLTALLLSVICLFCGGLSFAAGQDYALVYKMEDGHFPAMTVYCQGGQKFRREVVNPAFLPTSSLLWPYAGSVKMAYITRSDLGVRWLINMSTKDVLECELNGGKEISFIYPDIKAMRKIGEERVLQYDCDIFADEEGGTIWATKEHGIALKKVHTERNGEQHTDFEAVYFRLEPQDDALFEKPDEGRMHYFSEVNAREVTPELIADSVFNSAIKAQYITADGIEHQLDMDQTADLRRVISSGIIMDNIYSIDLTDVNSIVITLGNGRILTLLHDPGKGLLYIDKRMANWEKHNVYILQRDLLLKYVIGDYILQLPKEMDTFLESLKVVN